jgi:methylenetetrahydrofolate dehydrogenase (NADP+)/methenyltetrahydrofolate cyclohydrolase
VRKNHQWDSYAGRLADRITAAVPVFTEKTGRVPGLAVVLVGSDPASEIYVRSKGRKCRELGFVSFEHILPVETGQDGLLRLIEDLNADNAVDGILVQLALPKHLDEWAIILPIDPKKDFDGLHPENAARLIAGRPGLVS